MAAETVARAWGERVTGKSVFHGDRVLGGEDEKSWIWTVMLVAEQHGYT